MTDDLREAFEDVSTMLNAAVAGVEQSMTERDAALADVAELVEALKVASPIVCDDGCDPYRSRHRPRCQHILGLIAKHTEANHDC